MTVWSAAHVTPVSETLASWGRVWEPTLERTHVGISAAAGGVPHQAHEGLALPLREIREESNQIADVGGHPKWSGIFLDCGISLEKCRNSTPRGGTETAAPPANASGAAVSFLSCESARLSACTDCAGFCAAFSPAALIASGRARIPGILHVL